MKSIKELQDENIEKALGTIENAIAFDNEDKGNALACLELVKEKLEINKEYIKEINAKNKELESLTNKSKKLASIGEKMGIDPLTALDNLVSLVSDYHKIDNIDYHLIKQKLLKLKELEEIEKALEIIVEKRVNIYAIMQSCRFDDYHWFMDSYESDFINEEEYNLIKKVVDKYDKEKK